jgi:hypothetical protein
MLLRDAGTRDCAYSHRVELSVGYQRDGRFSPTASINLLGRLAQQRLFNEGRTAGGHQVAEKIQRSLSVAKPSR